MIDEIMSGLKWAGGLLDLAGGAFAVRDIMEAQRRYPACRRKCSNYACGALMVNAVVDLLSSAAGLLALIPGFQGAVVPAAIMGLGTTAFGAAHKWLFAGCFE